MRHASIEITLNTYCEGWRRPLPPITTIFMIVPFIFDRGISNLPVVFAKTEHPIVL
jgi:hypothetical protein